jgi:hypothetical protein
VRDLEMAKGHTSRLAERFGFMVSGIDPVEAA